MVQYNAHSSGIIALIVIFGSLSILAVILRFVARSRTKAKYGADDWFAVASLISVLAYMGIMIWATQYAGYDPTTLPKPVLVQYLKSIYILPIISALSITAAKFSVLCLYRRLFSRDKRLQNAVTIVGVLCLLWFIAATVAVSLKCVPIEKSWNPRMAGTCFNFQVFVVAIECPNSFLDFVIAALPAGVIRGLHLPLQRKILICVIFILGAFVGIIGFIRIALVYKPNTIALQQLGMWLLIQLAIAVVCACLPTFGPFLPSGNLLVTTLKEWYSSVESLLRRRHRPSTSRSKSGPYLDPNNANQPPDNHYRSFSDTGDRVVLTQVVGGGTFLLDQTLTERDYPSNAIRVKNVVEMV